MKALALTATICLLAATASPAWAIAKKPVVSTGTDTISRVEYDTVADQHKTLIQCLGDQRWLAARAAGDFIAIDQALATLGSITGARLEGPASVSRTQWNEQKAVFDAELARLTAKYGC